VLKVEIEIPKLFQLLISHFQSSERRLLIVFHVLGLLPLLIELQSSYDNLF